MSYTAPYTKFGQQHGTIGGPFMTPAKEATIARDKKREDDKRSWLKTFMESNGEKKFLLSTLPAWAQKDLRELMVDGLVDFIPISISSTESDYWVNITEDGILKLFGESL